MKSQKGNGYAPGYIITKMLTVSLTLKSAVSQTLW